MALCRSVDDPPEVCFNELSPFQDSQTLANEGFYRDQGTVVVVVVSDEGDNSRRMSQGDDEPDVYLEAFQDFSKPVKFVAIGPQWDGSSVSCVDTSVPTWSVERVESLANGSGGYYSSISDENCEPADFADELRKLGDLLQNLLTAFQLQSIPDITTITVYVDGQEIDRADPLIPMRTSQTPTRNMTTGGAMTLLEMQSFSGGMPFLATTPMFESFTVRWQESHANSHFRTSRTNNPKDNMRRALQKLVTLGLLSIGTAQAQDAIEVGILQDSDVNVVQKMLYSKDGKLEFGGHLGWMPFDTYTTTPLLNITGTLHRSETAAMEVSIGGGYSLKKCQL